MDIDELNDELERKSKTIETLDKDVDRLEAYSRRDTLRIFGLPEMVRESHESLKKNVITSVLNVACPDINWYQEHIVCTRRVGHEVADNPDNPRILLIKFLQWDKMMAVLKGRDKLREAGIRVGDDLTRRQRATLKHLSDKGQLGYFYKGELLSAARKRILRTYLINTVIKFKLGRL